MLLSETSDLVIRHTPAWQTKPILIDLIYLKGGRILAIAPTSISLYKDEASLLDPLSNGLISSADWSQALALTSVENGDSCLVKGFKAGVIHLAEEKTLLITPVAIQLFSSSNDALLNRNAIARIDIA